MLSHVVQERAHELTWHIRCHMVLDHGSEPMKPCLTYSTLLIWLRKYIVKVTATSQAPEDYVMTSQHLNVSIV